MKKGEIVGVTGLMGAGKTELGRAIAGIDKMDAGDVFVDGKQGYCRTPRQGSRAGSASVPVPDDREVLRAAMEAFDGDILLTTGATSAGKEDYLPGLLAELGELLVHGVNIRPASPLGFGRLGKALAVLLPGNPVAAMVGFDVFVRPAVQLQLGQREERWNRRVRGRLRRKLASALNRTDFVRVQLVGEGEVEPIRSGGAGVLTSVTRADGFVVVPRDDEGFEAGTEVEVYLY